ncbi:MAG: hypothetical protein R3316_05965 [Rhodovibrionaceae bacterium]|nr:hypothetical protein [Rhodovibrionaceae bacterium]
MDPYWLNLCQRANWKTRQVLWLDTWPRALLSSLVIVCSVLFLMLVAGSGIPGEDFIFYSIITIAFLVYPLIFARNLVREVPILLREKDDEIELFQNKIRSNVALKVAAANVATASGKKDRVLLLWVRVENKGEPTSLLNWRCTIRNGDHAMENILQPNTYTFHQPDGSPVAITPYELIYQKTVDPLPSGSKVTGVLPVNMRGASAEALAGKSLKVDLRCQDMYGAWTEVSQAIVPDVRPVPNDRRRHLRSGH